MFKAVFLALIVATALELTDGKLPSSIKICSRNDPNIAKCILDSVKDLQPRLGSGVLAPDFRIPGLEPLKLDNIHIDRGPNFQVFLTNMVVGGASNFKIEKLKVNLAEPVFDFIIHLPRIEFKGKYDMKVKVVLLDIVGKDEIVGALEDYKARVKLRGKTYQKNGKTYLYFEKIALKIIVGRKTSIDLKRLFDGNPTLGRLGNTFINENSQFFIGEIIPGLEKNLSEIFTKAANDVVANSSFDEMFPNSQG